MTYIQEYICVFDSCHYSENAFIFYSVYSYYRKKNLTRRHVLNYMVTVHFCFPEQIIQKTGPSGQTTIPYAAFTLVYKALESGSSVVSALEGYPFYFQNNRARPRKRSECFVWIVPRVHKKKEDLRYMGIAPRLAANTLHTVGFFGSSQWVQYIIFCLTFKNIL